MGYNTYLTNHQSAVTKPRIMVTTQVKSLPIASDDSIQPSRWVSIRIADNEPGLSVGQQQQILDSFSVKKRAEKETSLEGSYQIVTAKRGVKLYLRSPIAPDKTSSVDKELPQRETEFEILLPIS